jgi:hypothetical protein
LWVFGTVEWWLFPQICFVSHLIIALSHENEDLGFLSLHLSRTPMPRPPVTDDRHKLFGCMDVEEYPPC